MQRVPSRPIAGVVVPAAGRGTRLGAVTTRTHKEMLPLGGAPILATTLAEIVSAGIVQVVFVVSPDREPLRAFVEAHAPAGVRMKFTVQPEPTGVLDAIERGRALLPDGPVAVLYPDSIQLPDHRGFKPLVSAHERHGGSVIGLVRMTAERAARMGATARAIVRDSATTEMRIDRLEAASAPIPGEIHTAFAEIRAEDLGRSTRDEDNLAIWNAAAAEGRLTGVLLPGEVLDAGIVAGYEDAVQRVRGES